MARIVIAAFGTRGDVLPFTDVGRRFQDAGHHVVLTAPPDLVDEVTACGLQTRPVAVELKGDHDLDDGHPLRAALQFVLPAGMRTLGENLLAALHDEPADVLLLSPFAELAGHPLAEARKIPSIGVRLQPMSATAAFPPSLMGAWSGGPALNRGAGRLATAALGQVYGRTVQDFRDRLGLPERSQRSLRRERTHAGWPILHGVSPAVVPRPRDWRPGLEMVGYWWPRRPATWEPSRELVAFLDEGPPPVFLGLGSLMVSRAESARISDLVQEALRKVGARGVVQAGGAGLAITGTDVVTVGTVPHDWLFERVAAVVHSCGAGTTAAGLRAGLPAVAVPSPGGDQPFWARRLRDLGVSAATLPRPSLTADRLARALDTALGDPGHRAAAESVAARIAEEDGAAGAVTTVERLVRA